MPLVMFRPGEKGTFRHAMFNPDRTIAKVIEFSADTPVDVSWDDMQSVSGDLYLALRPVRVAEDGRAVVIPKEEFDAIMSVNAEADEAVSTEPDDAELEKLTAPEPIAVDVFELPLSPQMAEAIKPPESGVSSGTQPARRPRK